MRCTPRWMRRPSQWCMCPSSEETSQCTTSEWCTAQAQTGQVVRVPATARRSTCALHCSALRASSHHASHLHSRVRTSKITRHLLRMYRYIVQRSACYGLNLDSALSLSLAPSVHVRSGHLGGAMPMCWPSASVPASRRSAPRASRTRTMTPTAGMCSTSGPARHDTAWHQAWHEGAPGPWPRPTMNVICHVCNTFCEYINAFARLVGIISSSSNS